MKPSTINLRLLLIVLAVSAGLFAIGWQRLQIDTDIVSSLPRNDPVIGDALQIFRNHPMLDQLTIDVGLDRQDPDLLVACAGMLTAQLRSSGLFKSVGLENMGKDLPRLAGYVADHLPLLFSQQELERQVLPLLTPEHVSETLAARRADLLQMGAIGQSAFIAKDPLGLKDLVLARLLYLAPSQSARFYKGALISGDNRHLLVTATPLGSGTDTAAARRLAELVTRAQARIQQTFAPQGVQVTLTPVGAYRAALDNELIVRADVRNAIVLATLGIALLLLIAFPRPLIGLLSLLPAMVGTLTAFFVFAWIHPSMSIVVLGFGGAIISITVDHGIAYLLFMDRPCQTFGRAASQEVWSVGLLAVLTTVGAFSVLMITGFPIFQQLGLFTALGISFSFLFVHTVFPRIFPSLPASRRRWLPLPVLADRLFSMGPRGAWAALVFFIVMVFAARPGFNPDLGAMNTVSTATQAAEKKLTAV